MCVNGDFDMQLTDELRKEYESRFAVLQIRPERSKEVDALIAKMIGGRTRYEAVSAATKVPWFVIGSIHGLECSFMWDCHIFNGDPLDRRTVHVPSGRPVKGQPPFTWEESAIDAMEFEGFTSWNDWSIAGTCFTVEKYNGFGYRKRGIPSPYLYGGTQFQMKGKFTSDGHFDAFAETKQIGATAIFRRLLDSSVIIAQDAASIANQ